MQGFMWRCSPRRPEQDAPSAGSDCPFEQVANGLNDPRQGTRHWRQLSRSRKVTVPSVSVCPSTVMPNGVPASSCRR